MNRVFDFSALHLVLGIPFFIGMCITVVASLKTLSELENLLNAEPFVYWFTTIMSGSIIPVTFYFVFFTKFNNPFRKKEVKP